MISSLLLLYCFHLVSLVCDPMDCSTPGLPVHHQLSKLAQTPDHQVGDAIRPSPPLSSPLLPPPIPPASGAFPMCQFFPSGGQSVGASASASVLPMNIQDWFPLGVIGWISLQSKGLSRFFSSKGMVNHSNILAVENPMNTMKRQKDIKWYSICL